MSYRKRLPTWKFSSPSVASLNISPHTLEQLADNLVAVGICLMDDAEMAQLNDTSQGYCKSIE
jgi:aryl-alcohol dehydrogenase-like predicted oxidoreductase